MSEQWVCRVCGTECTGDLTSCTKCHFIRGATPESAAKGEDYLGQIWAATLKSTAEGKIERKRPSGCAIVTLILVIVLLIAGYCLLYIYNMARLAK